MHLYFLEHLWLSSPRAYRKELICWGNFGFGKGVRVNILKPTSIIYHAFEKTQPIHILDFTESWPIHGLFFEFIYPFIYSVICRQVYKWPVSRENLFYADVKTKAGRVSEWKICAYTWVSENLGHSNSKHQVIHILSFLKRGGVSFTLGHWKEGAIRHAHPYYDINREPPSSEVLNHLWCRICWKEDVDLYNIHVHNPECCCFMVFPDLVRSV